MSGGQMRIAAGCLRNDGAGWELLCNATHFAAHIASVSNDTKWIEVTTEPGIDGVFAILVTADETLARNGIVAGGSGGGSLTRIGLYKNGTQLNPNSVNTNTYPNSNLWLVILQHVPEE